MIFIFAQFLHEPRYVPRIGNQDILRAFFHSHDGIHGQGENMVERQAADIDQSVWEVAFFTQCRKPDVILRSV